MVEDSFNFKKKRVWGTLILIFLLALSARILYLGQIKQNLLFLCPIVDSGIYNLGAKLIAEGTFTGYYDNIGRIPLYRYFLATIYKIGGYDIYLSCLIQSVIGAFSCCLIYLLGANIFNRRVGMISGVVASLYWPFIAFNAKTLPVNLAIFFSLCAIMSIYKFLTKKNMLWVVISGIFFALSTLARPNILLLLPVISMWFLFYFFKKSGVKKSILYSTIFIVSFVSVTAFSMMMDYSMRSEVMPIHSRFGIGLYLGSDLDYTARLGYRWERIAKELLNKNLVTIKEKNIYWLKKTKELIVKNPADYIKNLHKKIYILWNYYEFSPNECINHFRLLSKFLVSLPLDFGFIAAFSIMGMLLAWRKFNDIALPIYLFIFVYLISLLPFTPYARFRLPLVPFLIIFASYGISELIEGFRHHQRRNVLQFIIFFVPLFILTNSNSLMPYLRDFDRPRYHRGSMYLRYIDDAEDALEEFKWALKKHPYDADIYRGIGDAYKRLGDSGRAKISHEKASRIKSRYRSPWEN